MPVISPLNFLATLAPFLGAGSRSVATDDFSRLTLRISARGHEECQGAYEIAKKILSEPDLRGLEPDLLRAVERLKLIEDGDRFLAAERPHRPCARPSRRTIFSPPFAFSEEATVTRPEEEGRTEVTGLTLRDYQRAYIDETMASIRSGADRGLIRDPWQVGKTLAIGPLAEACRSLFPGKKALVVVPRLVIHEQILSDLRKTFSGRVGIIDAHRKDFREDHDLLVASAQTLGRKPHLKKLNPREYGLVIVEEASFARAKTWRRILRRLGFLDENGLLRKNEGKYLLGLTADPVSLRPIFGKDAPIVSHGIPWFIGRGYLHRVQGVRMDYESLVQMRHQTIDGEELAVPLASEAYDDAVVRVYKDWFQGKKVMVNVARIDHAERLAAAFNRALGAGRASAVHSEMANARVLEAVKAFDEGPRLKVLIQIDKLSHGYRARGVDGVINTFERSSLSRYGQQIGRPLGKSEDEPQRTILVVDMHGKGRSVYSPASIPRLFGISGYLESDRVLDPLKDRGKPGHPPRRGRPMLQVRAVRGKKRGLMHYEYVRTGDKVLQPNLFPRLMRQALENRYDGDPAMMAQDLRLDLDRLDRYLYGELPESLEEVRVIASRIGSIAERAWMEDGLFLMEKLYPIGEALSPKAGEWIRLFRRAVLELGQGSLRGAAVAAGIHGGMDTARALLFGENFPLTATPLRTALRIVTASEVAPLSEIRLLMAEAIDQETSRQGFSLPPDWPDAEDEKIAPGYVDVFDRDVEPLDQAAGVAAEPGIPERATSLREAILGVWPSLSLSPIEQRTLDWYFGLGVIEEYDHSLSFREIGDKWNLSRERIRQVQENALTKLRGHADRLLGSVPVSEILSDRSDGYEGMARNSILQRLEKARGEILGHPLVYSIEAHEDAKLLTSSLGQIGYPMKYVWEAWERGTRLNFPPDLASQIEKGALELEKAQGLHFLEKAWKGVIPDSRTQAADLYERVRERVLSAETRDETARVEAFWMRRMGAPAFYEYYWSQILPELSRKAFPFHRSYPDFLEEFLKETAEAASSEK